MVDEENQVSLVLRGVLNRKAEKYKFYRCRSTVSIRTTVEANHRGYLKYYEKSGVKLCNLLISSLLKIKSLSKKNRESKSKDVTLL